MTRGLFHFGLSLCAVPEDVRRPVCLDTERLRELSLSLAPLCRGRLILSTCERFELYASGGGLADAAWILMMSRLLGVSLHALHERAQILRNGEAAEHLLRVSAGLESRIVGEPHVLGQVRVAYQTALDAGTLDAELAALGRAAICAGKRARSETVLNRADRSIVTVAVEHLERSLPSIREASVVVVGSGTIGAGLLASLRQHGVSQLTVVSRNVERAETLAERWNARALDLAHLSHAICEADAVLACTSAPSAILSASKLASRRHRSLHLIDLSMPRNIDPEVTSVPGVFLVDLDVLTDGQAVQSEGVRAAESIIAEEFARYCAWQRGRAVSETIRRWTGDDRGHRDDITRRRRRILHQRIARLKQEAVV